METQNIVLFVCVGLGMFAVIGGLAMLSNYYTLNGIKSRTVGDGQHGTARFATEKEIRETYAHIPYRPEQWRKGEALPAEQGLVVGYKKKGSTITALVDSGDIHCLMIGAAGVGKTANFLYPNIEYACASGMSLPDNRHERRSVPELCRYCKTLLRLPYFCLGFEKPHPLRWKQHPYAGQQIYG